MIDSPQSNAPSGGGNQLPSEIVPEFFVALTEGYDDPFTIYGPFATYDAAVQAHYDQAVESGAIEEDEGDPHEYYLGDDAVRIARLDRVVLREEDA